MLRIFVICCVVAMVLFSFLLSGCHGSPNEEEMKALEEQNAAAGAAEKALADCESEKADLESQLAEKNQKLDDLKKEKEVVANRLESM